MAGKEAEKISVGKIGKTRQIDKEKSNFEGKEEK